MNSPATSKLPPRLSAAVTRGLREGAAISLAVVALVLAMALLSFDPRDPGFSSTGIGETVHNRVGQRGCLAGGPPVFLLWAAGLPAAAGAWDRRGAPRSGPPRARSQLAHQRPRPRPGLRRARHVQLRPRGAALVPRSPAPGRRRSGRDGRRQRPVERPESARRNPGAAGGVGGERGGGVRRFLAARDRRPRRRGVARHALVARSAPVAARNERRPRTQAGAHGRRRSRKPQDARAASAAHRSPSPDRAGRASAPRRNGRCRCSIRRRRASCRRSGCSTIRRGAGGSYSAEALEAMSRLVELKLKDFGVEVEVVAVHPGPVITRFEMRPAPGVKVEPDHRARQGSGARAVGDQRARGRSDSGQVGDGPGDPERTARGRHARRDHQEQGLRGSRIAAGARARQGHRRRRRWWWTSRACRTC